MTQEIDEINKLLERDVCNEAVVLAEANDIENIDKAKEEKSFLIYEDRVETLKEFCKNRTCLGSTDWRNDYKSSLLLKFNMCVIILLKSIFN